MDINLKKLSVKQLLVTFGDIVEELKERKIIKTRNNPVADYSEWLVWKTLGFFLQRNSNAGFDALDREGKKYQIKGRCLSDVNKSRQLGVIRNLKDNKFDFLIGTIFDKNFTVLEAYKIPHDLITEHARFSSHQNGHILQLKGDILAAKGVERIDEKMKSLMGELL